MKTLMILMMTTGVTYANMTSPLMFMLLIIIQTLVICAISWIHLNSGWFAYILFLIFLGGLMVLFIYITSLASNEMFKMDIKTATYIMSTTLIFSMMFLMMNMETKQLTSINLSESFTSLYYSNFKLTLILAMIYLLLTLIVVVKIANKLDAPIKNTL